MKWIIGLLWLLTSFNVDAYQRKSKCNHIELGLKNCPIISQGYRFHFLDDKVLLHDGVWRVIEELPLQGKKTEWKNIEVTKLGKDVFVQLYIWTEPFGEVEVQNLKWFVLKVKPKKLQILSERIVQKRSRDFTNKVKPYKFDQAVKHKLVLKKGHVFVKYKKKLEKIF